MLHIIDHFPIKPSELEQTSNGDTVVLTNNAIYAAKQNTDFSKLSKQALNRLNMCVLGKDMRIRGVDTHDILSGVAILDDYEYLDITDYNSIVRSWN